MEECKPREKQVVTSLIGKLCLKKAHCMLLLAGMLKRGKIKLSGNSTNALSFFNPYKERGETVVEGLTGGGKPVDENTK